MHSNSYDPDRLREQAAIKQAEVDLQRAEVERKEKELKAIERLVSMGINPIAARCGVYGWKSDRNREQDTACIIAAGRDDTIAKEANTEE